MTRHAIASVFGVAVTLVLTAGGGARDEREDKETVEARKEVLAVVKMVEDGKSDKEIADRAAAFRKKDVDLNYLMKVYKLKERGGLGYGENPEPRSGLEAMIIALGRGKGPSAGTLKKERKALIKLAQVNVAMAEIARPHHPGKKFGKDQKEWDKWLDDQKQAARDLIDAVKKEDGPAVARAAKELLAACTDCHSSPPRDR